MKSFFHFLFYSSFLFVFAAIASLYLGWINFSHPNYYRGVIYYKTSGYQPTLLIPTQWYWNWQNIIPSNTTIFVADTSLIQKKLVQIGSLPSADVYSEILERPKIFDYSVELGYEYSLREEDLVSLYSQGILTTSLDQASLQQSIEKILRNGFNQALEDHFSRQEVPSLEILQGLETLLSASIKETYPFLDNFSLEIRANRFPDFVLYDSARALMLEILKAKAEEKRQEELRQAKESTEEENRLLWLERYGKLIQEYPDLKEVILSDNLKLFSFFQQN